MLPAAPRCAHLLLRYVYCHPVLMTLRASPSRQFAEGCSEYISQRHGELIAEAALAEERRMAVRMHTYTYADVASVGNGNPSMSIPGLQVCSPLSVVGAASCGLRLRWCV